MKSRELVELAALAASHGNVLISTTQHISDAGLHEYWTASKSRLDCWGQVLRKYQREVDYLGPRWARLQWPQISVTIEEILTGEILARVWTAVLAAHDRRNGHAEAEPVARVILVGQQEARNRALRLMTHELSEAIPEMNWLNQLRRRCERWTDLLLAHIADDQELSQLAFDPCRAADFVDSVQSQRRAGLASCSWKLTLASLRTAFQTSLTEQSTCPELNARIAASVLCCFPPDLFDSTGLVRSLWYMRLQTNSRDAETMLNQLLDLGPEPLPRRRFGT